MAELARVPLHRTLKAYTSRAMSDLQASCPEAEAEMIFGGHLRDWQRTEAGVFQRRERAELTERLPIPSPAIFLLAAAAASDLWPSLYQHATIRSVERIAVVALIVILFNGGLDIGWPRFRKSAFPIVALGVLGTFMTAGVVMLFAHYALGFGWMLAGVAGAALAPTDPAVMFSVLGNFLRRPGEGCGEAALPVGGVVDA